MYLNNKEILNSKNVFHTNTNHQAGTNSQIHCRIFLHQHSTGKINSDIWLICQNQHYKKLSGVVFGSVIYILLISIVLL